MRRFCSCGLYLIILAVFLLSSCRKGNKFTVEGSVLNAKGKMLYFEHVGMSRITILDSAKLDEEGDFKFRQPSNTDPDFYRLRLNGYLINVAIDSSETVKVNSDGKNFATAYTVSGSLENQKIKQLALLQLKTSGDYNRLQKEYNAKKIKADEYVSELKKIIDTYKKTARDVIYAKPYSTSAYFALFQQVDGLRIFDPFNKEDNKAFMAVANCWNVFHPKSDRTKHLCNLALQTLKVLRGEKPLKYVSDADVNYFDISLPNVNDRMVNLNKSCKGKVVLLDFTAYQMQDSPSHNIKLGELYKKYKKSGFEIYQVSLDADDNLWKNAAVSLPWICVRDPQSIYSKVATNYNVKDLPTGFIINRAGEVVKRVESYANVGSYISKYL